MVCRVGDEWVGGQHKACVCSALRVKLEGKVDALVMFLASMILVTPSLVMAECISMLVLTIRVVSGPLARAAGSCSSSRIGAAGRARPAAGAATTWCGYVS